MHMQSPFLMSMPFNVAYDPSWKLSYRYDPALTDATKLKTISFDDADVIWT